MKSILVIQLKRIGDLILTLPALDTLRRAYPAAKITLIIDGDTAELIPLIRGMDRVLVYKKNAPNFETFRRLIFGRFDATLDFTGTDRSFLLTGLSKSKRRIAFRWAAGLKFRQATYTDFVDSPVRERHTVDHYLDLLSALGLESAEIPWQIQLPDSSRKKIRGELKKRAISRPYIVVHVGAARAEKYWQAENWAAVIDFLQRDRKRPCVLIGGHSPMEKEAIENIRRACTTRFEDLSGRLSLVASAALIEGAELFLGIDSGPSHLAAALKIPQITLFGPTNPFHWRARHEKSVILQGGKENPVTHFEPQARGGDLKDLSTPEVIHAINHLFPKS